MKISDTAGLTYGDMAVDVRQFMPENIFDATVTDPGGAARGVVYSPTIEWHGIAEVIDAFAAQMGFSVSGADLRDTLYKSEGNGYFDLTPVGTVTYIDALSWAARGYDGPSPVKSNAAVSAGIATTPPASQPAQASQPIMMSAAPLPVLPGYDLTTLGYTSQPIPAAPQPHASQILDPINSATMEPNPVGTTAGEVAAQVMTEVTGIPFSKVGVFALAILLLVR